MTKDETAFIIEQTKKWIANVVVNCNFCPFAAKEMKNDTVHYEVLPKAVDKTALHAALVLMRQLDSDKKIETSFLILPGSFTEFSDYLHLVKLAEKLVAKECYEGIYQIASFHPGYLFAGSNEADPSNYTNRSPYAMLHFLREASLSHIIDRYTSVENIPERNIAFAREKGLKYMQLLLAQTASDR